VKGNVSLNGRPLASSDAAAVTEEWALSIAGSGPTGGEILLFDLA
jgi:hypothetical protein